MPQTTNISVPEFMVQYQMYLQLPKALLLIEVIGNNKYVFTLEGKKILLSLDEIYSDGLRSFLAPGFNDTGKEITLDEYLAVIKHLM